MSFEISIRDDISLRELLNIHKSGGVVLKTPHVGNIYPNNLAIASLGIPMLFYDRTIGINDANFHPHEFIVGRKSELIANSNILTTHSTILNIPQSNSNSAEIKVGSGLVDFHMAAMKRALPDSLCFTYTEYLQRNREMILSILEKITELRPGLWTRAVDDSGNIFKCVVKNWDSVLKLNILSITDNREGLIIPNPVNILFHGTIDTKKAGVKDAYLLSGPDMYRYIDGYREVLIDLYNHIRQKLTWSLPDIVRCHIIPVASMRFIVEKINKDALDTLVTTYLQYRAVEHFQDTKEYSQKLIHEKNELQKKIITCLENNFDTFKSTMFYRIEKADCFTQYDLLNSNGLYIHPWAVNSKMKDVSIAYDFLSELFFNSNRLLREI